MDGGHRSAIQGGKNYSIFSSNSNSDKDDWMEIWGLFWFLKGLVFEASLTFQSHDMGLACAF